MSTSHDYEHDLLEQDDEDKEEEAVCDSVSLLSNQVTAEASAPSGALSVSAKPQQTKATQRRIRRILCDMGYGIPNEARPRKEKILAISRQLVNFLKWQLQASTTMAGGCQLKQLSLCVRITVVACPNHGCQTALLQRMLHLWTSETGQRELPANFSVSMSPLEKWLFQFPTTNSNWNSNCNSDSAGDTDTTVVTVTTPGGSTLSVHDELQPPVYLSPDAAVALDPALDPPSLVVVAILIDRRVQVNRSTQRAMQLSVRTARWPLETVSDVLHANEPLNVDCILHGMQQWYWNCSNASNSTTPGIHPARRFQDAAIQALQHHQERHPARPQHLLPVDVEA
jgi:hypothetical protein